MERFVRTSRWLLFFSAVPWIAVKLIVKEKLTRRQIDVSWIFSVRERGRVRVLLLIVIVLFQFSSVQCLYSRRLQEGSRVKQVKCFFWWRVACDCVEGEGVVLGGIGRNGWGMWEGGVL